MFVPGVPTARRMAPLSQVTPHGPVGRPRPALQTLVVTTVRSGR
jgi:hypothetical protein